MPVANQRQNKQQDRDQQQPGGFRRIDVVPRMLRARHTCVGREWHTGIVVRSRKKRGSFEAGATLPLQSLRKTSSCL
jgi:hypothetical protein